MKMRLLSTLLVAGGLALGANLASKAVAEPPAGTTPAPSTDHKHQGEGKDHKHEGKKDKKEEKSEKGEKGKGVAIGDTAPAFTLTDTDGKSVSLSDFKGKVVVLEWFNPECPFIVKHHQVNHTFNELNEQYSSKGVVFLAINSSAAGKEGSGKDNNAAKKKEYGMQYPVLLDENGAVGHAYGATNTPHCFVIGADGKIAYMGAIDNNTDPRKAGDKNYVRMALDNVLAGKPADPAQTKPYGCGVKYAKQ
jgi:peroxiredoxin